MGDTNVVPVNVSKPNQIFDKEEDMKKNIRLKLSKLAVAVFVYLTCAGEAHAQASKHTRNGAPALGVTQHQNSPEQPSAAFDKLKSLAGEWEGMANEGGKEIPTTTSFRLVSDGSVLMNLLAPGTPHEMITMFHMDASELLATHYCVAHNQPRFRFVSTPDPNVVAFEFKDATNLSSPAAGHMDRVKFTLLDPNHHFEEWTFLANGQANTRRFDFHRKQ